MSDPIRESNDASHLLGSFGDLEKVLNLADSYEEKCIAIRSILWRGNCAVFIVGCLVLLTNGWLNLEESISSQLRYLGGASAFAYALWLLLFWLPSYRSMKRNLANNVRSVNQLADLLRAIESILGQKSTLSFLDHSSLRIRIGRFDIGPEEDALPARANPKPFVPRVISPVHYHELREREQSTPS